MSAAAVRSPLALAAASLVGSPSSRSLAPVGGAGTGGAADGDGRDHEPTATARASSAASRSRPVTALTSFTNMSDDARLAMGAGMSAADLFALREAAKIEARQKRETAKLRYERRYLLMADFWWEALRHASWRRTFREAVEGPSAFSNIGDSASACRITRPALVTAFWNAACFPEYLRMPVALVDDYIKKAFLFFNVDVSDTIDYRDLFASLAVFQVDIMLPTVRIVRAWYHAWDGDSNGGLLPDEFARMIQSVTTKEEDRWHMDRILDAEMPWLVGASIELRRGKRTLNDIMTSWANAKRLSRRFGDRFTKTAVAAGEEPPSFLPVVWSPFDAALEAKEKAQPRIHLDVICEWISRNEEVRGLIQRMRVENTHPVYRKVYEENEARKKLEEEMRLREIELGQRADAHYRAALNLRVLTGWYKYVQVKIAVRKKLFEMRRRRSIKHWLAWTRASQQVRAHFMVAQRHYMENFVIRMFGTWVTYWQVELAKNAANMKRAETFFEFSTLQKGFDRLREYTQTKKAQRHYTDKLRRRSFDAWASGARLAVKTRVRRQVAAAKESSALLEVTVSHVTTSVEEIARRMEEEMEQRRAEEAAAAHAEAAVRFAEEAKEEAEGHMWSQARDAANKKLRDRRIRDQQEKDRKAARIHAWEKAEAAFEADWRQKIADAVAAEKATALAFITSGRGDARDVLQTETQRIISIRDLSDAMQPLSDFRATIDLKDGCIHFIRDADPTAKPPIVKQDFNIDAMTAKESQTVAIAHYCGRRGADLQALMFEKRDDARLVFKLSWAISKVQRAWKARNQRFETFTGHLRPRLDLLCDPYTGELYYLDTRANVSYPFPLRMLGGLYLLHPLPDWAMRVSIAPDGTANVFYQRIHAPKWHHAALVERERRERRLATIRAQRNRTNVSPLEELMAASLTGSPVRGGSPVHGMTTLGGSTLSLNGRSVSPLGGAGTGSGMLGGTGSVGGVPADEVEEETRDTPPPGYVMCQACGYDFARRECLGTDCSGYKYCWQCFVTYHPWDHDEYRKHWDTEVSTILYVKPGGRLTDPMELQMMEGKIPRRQVALRSSPAGGGAAAAAGDGGLGGKRKRPSEKLPISPGSRSMMEILTAASSEIVSPSRDGIGGGASSRPDATGGGFARTMSMVGDALRTRSVSKLGALLSIRSNGTNDAFGLATGDDEEEDEEGGGGGGGRGAAAAGKPPPFKLTDGRGDDDDDSDEDGGGGGGRDKRRGRSGGSGAGGGKGGGKPPRSSSRSKPRAADGDGSDEEDGGGRRTRKRSDNTRSGGGGGGGGGRKGDDDRDRDRRGSSKGAGGRSRSTSKPRGGDDDEEEVPSRSAKKRASASGGGGGGRSAARYADDDDDRDVASPRAGAGGRSKR